MPRHAQNFLPLSGVQFSGDRQCRTETIDAHTLLIGVAIYGNAQGGPRWPCRTAHRPGQGEPDALKILELRRRPSIQ